MLSTPRDPDRAGNGGEISDQKNTSHDERRTVSGNERSSSDGGHHDDIADDLPSGQHDRITDPVQTCAATREVNGPSGFATGPDSDGDRWAWNRAGPAERRRNNHLPNDRAKGADLSKTTIEEVKNVRPDHTRERIAALRRSFVEAGERQYRAAEFFRRRLEETSERLQSFRERIDAKLGATVERIRERITEVIASVRVMRECGGGSLGLSKRPTPLAGKRINGGHAVDEGPKPALFSNGPHLTLGR